MNDPLLVVQQALYGFSEASVLFLLASGMTLVFGLMRIVNMAHGAFYLVGAYIGIVVSTATGNLLVAILAGAAVVAALAFAADLGLLRWLRGQELPEVLVTIGLTYIIGDLCLAIFGGDPLGLAGPAKEPAGGFQVGSVTFPWFRLLVIGIAVVIGVGLVLVQHRTRVGAILRAGVDDRETIAAHGINIRWVFTWMFVAGAALAGAGGVIDAGLENVVPNQQWDFLVKSLVVVIVGGLGSIAGAAVGAVGIALIDVFAKVYLPDIAYFTIFLPMALILIFRPNGLFGKKA